ncbi:MAG: type II toxin-antitoxin system RelB/DinJ family antitoxin [Acidobacteria bacterium]|nr:type II toxin-antitoxin system RelB/DinJ family antitoxin [Acidobacteriota bacterium]MBU4330681.1 type II toxin-antitoxin system RelB/DinJ family antitoxin [Acidobacteriota bacterium]MBU4495979.1 type II toxin-antitoxin system RelB/DinJ family antitoxin [Acidobacteriota bacterium]MCG2816716.1 type II toxin-antitoxin system RelB/DinJ family antitoxin [Candidatus Aminicenantes bacterium]
MAKTSVIQARIDPEIKKQAMKIFNVLQISMSEAISLYLTQVTLHHGIPFEVKIPNELTAKTLRDSEKKIGLHRVSDVDELIEDLEN